MSLELTPEKLEITTDAGRLIVNENTKMVPLVYQGLHTKSVAFPNVAKHYYERAAIAGTSGNNHYQSWVLTVFARNDEGSVKLADMPAGSSPNLIIANIKAQRTSNPDESVFGPFLKAVPENVWMPIRSGLRLEYNAFIRRIVWLEISGGAVYLRWKQSSSNYAPIGQDFSVSYPDRILTVQRPPGYLLGTWKGSGFIGVPADVITKRDAVNFASTWSFDINLGVMQV